MYTRLDAIERKSKRTKMKSQWQFYLMLLPPLLYILTFHYTPMFGIVMAFKKFSVSRGIWGSQWVGFTHFKQFLASPSSLRIIWNTLYLGIYTLIVGFPIPILLAIGLNEVGNQRFKKTVQMVTYAPYFISTVVMVGLVMQITDLRTGVINDLLRLVGKDPINFFGSATIFPSLYVWTGIWQTTGYSAIIYLAALSGVSKELQEVAIVDGASRLQRIWHIDLPAIRPQIIILLIFNVGAVMNIGFEKVYLMQNPLNMATSEVIATFVYKIGLVNADYSFSTAVGLFNSVISFILLITVNELAKRFSDTGVW
ncbi:MAG: sugar ABC transporter permease [Epulopiscium sp.]|nr:sugar ABC transporter permease [Candidatus Epulonipiscium sp.]